MNVEQIVAEMPKVSINSISEDEQVEFGIYPHAVEIITQAQCQLLAEQGWRKVPNMDEMIGAFIKLTGLDRGIVIGDAAFMCGWLLEAK